MSCRDCSDIRPVSRKFATCAQCRTRVGRTQRSVSTCGGLFLIVARGGKLPRPDRSAVADFHCRWVHLREPDFKGQLLRARTESQGTAKRARRFGYPPKLKRLVKLLGWP
ncbi:hypothetical protein BDV27DRAFT_130274 [Aspergillus caelatus]|uniref:Uncharacterized protein n=1 Tax=Aspergillus caelatus TaxID=61420 RepID=A0A5N7A1W2_9EURO|nr:uncharacterized protein BDV27DRAFT_130274 [Aspergillus caelatus]KAE8363199.1 hypothetical protein BDV27DRAFT_130274 [Aspergillus caelatus]